MTDMPQQDPLRSGNGEPFPTTVVKEVALASASQPAWASRKLKDRLRLLRALRQSIVHNAEALVEAVETGRPRQSGETLASEVLPLVESIRFLERRASRILAPRAHRRRYFPVWLAGVSLEILREPFGVILVIGPSNYPLFLPGVQIVQALAAGNAVVVKPGTTGLPVMSLLRDLAERSGFDAGVLRVLDESALSAEAAIAAGVDKVVLTGSAVTGRKVLGLLSDGLTPSTMELSGCDATFVCPDADLELVTKALCFGMRLNAGATCIAPHRVFVPQALASDLETRLVEALRPVGSLEVACAVAERAQSLVNEAVAAGAVLLCGEIQPGKSFRPVVLANATSGMRLLAEDVFAPVVTVIHVDDMAEAIRLDEECPYALGASVFGRKRSARRIARQINAGTIVINDMITPMAHPALPFGGRAESGFGITRGAEGLLEMTQVKAVAVRRGKWRPHLDPARAEDEAFLRYYLMASRGKGFWCRLKAGVAMLKAIARRTRGTA